MNKLTQRNMVLELLKDYPNQYKPVWWFVGEKHIRSKNKWVLLSHKAPTRLSELYQEGLVNRKKIKGKTGACYYSYCYNNDEPFKEYLI